MNGNFTKPDLTRRGFFGLGGASVSLGLISWPFGTRDLAPSDEILLNQIGFQTGGPGQVAVRSTGRVTRGTIAFDLIDASTGDVAESIAAKIVTGSDKSVGTADLGALTKPGTWHLRSGEVTSLSFQISGTPWRETERSLMRAFYLQRCGVALEDGETGLSHNACHTLDALSQATRMPRNCQGGWHDAGDFGKYVATTSVVIGELLSLYLEDPEHFEDNVSGLPESGNGEPDLLSEMRVGLAWLLKMQRPWGAFERKVSGNDWPSMTALPEEDTQDRFAYGVSTADTAKAVAALALAARAFEPVDAAAAGRFLAAAEKGQMWLANHGDVEVEHTAGDDNGSGRYLADENKDENWDDKNWDRADRLWAELELYLTTGREIYAEAIESRTSDMYIWPVSWSNPSFIGLMNFLRDERRDDVGGLRTEIRKRLIERAREYEKVTRLSPWGVATEEFGWGSNREVAARGRVLAAAYEETGDEKFLAAATSQADYLLGKNSFGLCFVTGAGSKSVQNPHHRFDLAARSRGRQGPIPGFLVGGPNGDVSTAQMSDVTNSRSYSDTAASFETNEFAIDYNAALLALLGRLKARPAEREQTWFRWFMDWFGH